MVTQAVPATAEHRRIVVSETLLSVAINALIPTAIIWGLALRPPADVTHQFLTLAQATFLASFMMSMGITAAVRRRLRSGVVAPLPRAIRLVPRLLVLRGLTWAAVALLTVLPIGVLAAQVVALGSFSRGEFALFNIVFGTLIGAAITPGVVWLALSDAPVPARATP